MEFEETKFRKLFEIVPDPTFLVDTDGVMVEVNDSFCNTLEYDKEEIVGKRIEDINFISEDTQKELNEKINRALEGEEIPPVTIQGKTKSGETKIGEINHALIREEEGFNGFVGVIRNITEREKTKQKLLKAKERYEELFEGANELVVTTNSEGYIKKVNKKALEVSKYSENELVGESILKIAHPKDKEKYINFWKEILDGKEETRTLRGQTKDGNTIWCKAGGRPIIKDEEIVEIQYNAKDITDRKKIEERQEFLYSLLRHDLKNKISVAQGYQQLLQDMDPTEEQRKYIDQTSKALEEGSKLIEKVRTLSKVGEAKLEDVSLDSIINDVIGEKKPKATEKGIDIEYNGIECKVQADPLLERIFSNLIENSIKHSKGNLIRIQVQENEEEAIITVEDDGKGIPDENKEKIFEEGFKSGDAAGTGLGLHLVKRITESYGGSIEVKDSELGGAKFITRVKTSS